MSNLVKDSFYLTRQQKERLRKKASEIGIKTSELIRRILDEYLNKKDGK